MNYLQNILSAWAREGVAGTGTPRPPRHKIWGGTDPSRRMDAMEEAGRLNAAADWEFANQQADKQFAQDYKMRELGLLEQFGQLPQRGNQRPNIGGRARIGSDFGMNPQAIDRQRNPGQFQPPERPRIVNNLTQLLRPFQG